MDEHVYRMPEVTRRDIRALVEATGNGIISVAQIYRTYEKLMQQQGREPVSKKMLGQALARCGQTRVTTRRDGDRGTRCRSISALRLPDPEKDDDPLIPDRGDTAAEMSSPPRRMAP